MQALVLTQGSELVRRASAIAEQITLPNSWTLNVHYNAITDRVHLQVTAFLPDNNDPMSVPALQSGRRWVLAPSMTKSEIVQTAFKAVLTFAEHEIREQFTYKGQAIFGPHFDVDQLVELATGGHLDKRVHGTKQEAV